MHLGNESITFKELVPIVLACAVWGQVFANMGIIAHCVNLGAVAVVNSGYSKVDSIMHLLGCLFFVRAYFQIDLLVVHLPEKENRVADAISRDNLPFLYSQVPGSQGWRSPISPALFDVLSSRHLNRTSRDWTRRFRDCIQQVLLRPPEGTTSRAYVVITPSAANSNSTPRLLSG